MDQDGLKADVQRARTLMAAWNEGQVAPSQHHRDYTWREWCEKVAAILPTLIDASIEIARLEAEIAEWRRNTGNLLETIRGMAMAAGMPDPRTDDSPEAHEAWNDEHLPDKITASIRKTRREALEEAARKAQREIDSFQRQGRFPSGTHIANIIRGQIDEEATWLTNAR